MLVVFLAVNDGKCHEHEAQDNDSQETGTPEEAENPPAENEPEGGKRCEQCFRLRLLEAGKIAKRYNFDYFCSTLTVSRHKNAELINSIGEEISKAVGVPWLPSDFKKKDGENRSVELSERLGIYRQLYCGCRYSLSAREAGTPDNNREDTE